jgi:LacI family repressor for deo operon, udp, cdd, tsx, nupC, and nupG
MAKTRKSKRSTAPGPRNNYNIREVAEAAKVSVATVSRTLQMPDVVAPQTRARVQAAIERLGYRPNAQARMLRTARTHVIVALVPDISNPFFSEVIRGIEQVAHQNGYSVLLGDTQNSRVREKAYAELLATRQADGLITLLAHIPPIVISASLPVVNACEYVKDKSITSVYVDNVAAAREAVEYLLTLGHRDIAFVTGPMDSPISIDRDQGYEEALQRAGIKRNRKLTAIGDFSVEAGIRAVDTLLAKKFRFTAVFCSNDEMAIGAMRAIKSNGLRVPEDVSVIGFDDIRFARYMDPPLTTVAQPKDELGREAMSMLIELLRGSDMPARKRILPTQLVVRGSTGRCPGKVRPD